MSNQGLRLAFYGKGGIGKSTVAANVSAWFAKMGKSVLHIGCDPKSDSTRTLMGRRIPTVLETLREKTAVTKEDILFSGYGGVCCVEAGGPNAGVGCAGKAISLMAEQLQELGVFQMNWDLIVYDVLGDVVCGGFAIPMRERFVDRVYVVTSEEFMSLYAANNLIRSISLIQQQSEVLFGGFIHNCRVALMPGNRLEIFAGRTQAGIAAKLSYSEELAEAEFQGKTVVECCPKSRIAEEIRILAEQIWNGDGFADVRPLSEEEFEGLCKGTEENLEGRI